MAGATDVYDVRRLRLIFYDNPFWGPYRGWFRRILSEPRYTDLDANLRHFAERYRAAASRLPQMATGTGDRARFREHYEHHIAAETAKIAQWQARLSATLPARCPA